MFSQTFGCTFEKSIQSRDKEHKVIYLETQILKEKPRYFVIIFQWILQKKQWGIINRIHKGMKKKGKDLGIRENIPIIFP